MPKQFLNKTVSTFLRKILLLLSFVLDKAGYVLLKLDGVREKLPYEVYPDPKFFRFGKENDRDALEETDVNVVIKLKGNYKLL